MSASRVRELLGRILRSPRRCSRRTRKARIEAILFVAMLVIVSAQAFAQAPASPPPQRLRDTGLFVGNSATEIGAGILAFSPQYPLWSDGAKKRRWISLPAGTFIDAS